MNEKQAETQPSPLGNVPIDWRVLPIGHVLKERREQNRSDLPLLSITANRGVIPRHAVEKRDTSNADKSKYLRIVVGDIGYNTMRMWQGVSALSQYEGIVSPAYTICIPTDDVSGDYLAQLFKHPKMISIFAQYSQGLVDDTLSLKYDTFSKLKIPLPNKSVQKYVASVLDDAAEGILTSTSLIEQLQVLKRAAMHELLTRGIPGRHEAFQDTELGEIPVGWDIKPLRAIGSWGGGGTPSKAKAEYWTTDGLPWVSPKDMRGPEVTDAEDHITIQAVRESSTNVYPEGTILLVARSGILRNTLPVAITRREVAINQDLKAILPGRHVSADFLYQLLEYHAPRILKACVKAGTTVESLQTAALHDYEVVLPPLEEQSEILEILESFDERIRVEQARGRQLSKVKEALTQQLLMGRLPVPDLEEVAPYE